MKKHTGCIVALVLVSTLLTATETPAQNPDAIKFQAFVSSERYQAIVRQAFDAIPASVFQRCPAMVSNGSKVTIEQPVAFGGNGQPNAGQWRQSFPVTGCGDPVTLSIFFRAEPDGKILSFIGVPGSTIATPVSQRDTLLYVRAAAGLVVKDCKYMPVKNTRFEGYGLRNPRTEDPGPAAARRPWWETWTLAACGRMVDVPVDFVPDQTGTQITAVASGVVLH